MWKPTLTRVTSSGRYLAEVDGLRFLAVFAVFVFHVRAYLNGKSSIDWRVPVADDWLANLALRGDYGVPLFFGISGFIVALPFAEHHLRGGPAVPLRAYFLRRLTRLAPPYLATVAAFSLLLVLVKHLPVRDLLPRAAASALYVHGLVYGEANVINVVSWSLEVEVQFYLVAPLLALVFRIRSALLRRALLAAAGYVVIALQPWVVQGNPRLMLGLAGALQYFFVGFLLADLHVTGGRGEHGVSPPEARAWNLVSAIGWPAMLLLCQAPWLARFLFPPLMLVLYLGAFRSPWARRVLTLRGITTIGGMCYSIYLIHYQVISLAGRATLRLAVTRDFWVNLILQAALLAVPVALASAAFFLLVEKPAMARDWPARLFARLRALRGSTRALARGEVPCDVHLPPPADARGAR